MGYKDTENSEEVWVIRHKETKALWRAKSGKTSWKKSSHAKNAWANTMEWDGHLTRAGITPKYKDPKGSFRRPTNYKFDDQDFYELCKLTGMCVFYLQPLDDENLNKFYEETAYCLFDEVTGNTPFSKETIKECIEEHFNRIVRGDSDGK